MFAPALALLLIAPAPGGRPDVALPGRFIEVAPGLYSGAEPDAAAFAALARIGVNTVVSVDGPVPDAPAAAAHGLRTVHLPIGYDGVPADAAARLAAVMRRFGPGADAGDAAAGGVFVHCHHGKHRGPAAAAVCGRAAGLLTASQTTDLLRAAGTSPRYAGLWRSVAAFDPAALPPGEPDLPAAAPPAGLAAAMIEIARLHELAEESARESAGDNNSLGERSTPAATLLAESLRESARLPGLAADVRAELRAAAELAGGDRAALDRRCTACHAMHRD